MELWRFGDSLTAGLSSFSGIKSMRFNIKFIIFIKQLKTKPATTKM